LEDRVREIENKVIEQDGKINALDIRLTNQENFSIKLENTILKDGAETRAILREVIKHGQNMEQQKLNMWLKLLGAGGVGYLIIQQVLSVLGK
jgi:hypothetical protein